MQDGGINEGSLAFVSETNCTHYVGLADCFIPLPTDELPARPRSMLRDHRYYYCSLESCHVLAKLNESRTTGEY